MDSHHITTGTDASSYQAGTTTHDTFTANHPSATEQYGTTPAYNPSATAQYGTTPAYHPSATTQYGTTPAYNPSATYNNTPLVYPPSTSHGITGYDTSSVNHPISTGDYVTKHDVPTETTTVIKIQEHGGTPLDKHHGTDDKHHHKSDKHHHGTDDKHHHGTDDKHHHGTDDKHHHKFDKHHHGTDDDKHRHHGTDDKHLVADHHGETFVQVDNAHDTTHHVHVETGKDANLQEKHHGKAGKTDKKKRSKKNRKSDKAIHHGEPDKVIVINQEHEHGRKHIGDVPEETTTIVKISEHEPGTAGYVKEGKKDKHHHGEHRTGVTKHYE